MVPHWDGWWRGCPEPSHWIGSPMRRAATVPSERSGAGAVFRPEQALPLVSAAQGPTKT